jgi:hypothetical protein
LTKGAEPEMKLQLLQLFQFGNCPEYADTKTGSGTTA